MVRSLDSRLRFAIEQIKSGCDELEDIRLINAHYKKCVKMKLDADVLVKYLDGDKLIKVYDELLQNGATIEPEEAMYDMEPDVVRKNIAWFTKHGVKLDDILRYFKNELYDPAYKPIDLAVSLLKAQVSKHLVFEMIAPHLRGIADVPEKLIHDLSLLMKNGIDRHRIMFWIEKYVSKADLIKYSNEFEKFGIDQKFYIEGLLNEYGIEPKLYLEGYLDEIEYM